MVASIPPRANILPLFLSQLYPRVIVLTIYMNNFIFQVNLRRGLNG